MRLNFQDNWSHTRIEHHFVTKRKHLEQNTVHGLNIFSVKTSLFCLYEGKTVETLGCLFGII